ncbi:hypothetical protein L0657_25685 [Dyadobacter sp. CY345]|uniref:hypothetical protein n=1 Tax=Dyadobacter sp. CY345 TaxID=2909335 RepID=UPI001F385187|nr:hypothetical protein [Dyadobacter sp. CY345]MCF2447372.1 hypothetical protein [Dyadobacter sp. CY345]
MKTSNKLLIVIAFITLIAMLGSNLEIQAKYKKMKSDDLLPGYISTTVKPIRVIVLKGNLNGFVEIQSGKTNDVKMHPTFTKQAKSAMHGDTLEVSLIYPKRNNFTETKVPYFGPTVHIDVTNLTEVISTDVSYKIKGLKTTQLKLQASGGYTLLDSTDIGQVTAVYKKEAMLKIAENNKLGQTNIKIQDKSELNVEKDIFSSLNMDIDSTARITMPGNMLYKLMKK